MVDKVKTITEEVELESENEYSENQRWIRFVCPNNHIEKIEDATDDLLWFCPECGKRRGIESNHIEPKNTKTDKI